MNENEIKHIEKSRQALEVALVGTKIVGLEKKAHMARLTLSDGRRVLFQEDGECCASGTLKKVSELVHLDHAITSVEKTENGDRLFIYAGAIRLGALDVEAYEGTGYYGFGFSIDVVAVDGSVDSVFNARED